MVLRWVQSTNDEADPLASRWKNRVADSPSAQEPTSLPTALLTTQQPSKVTIVRRIPCGTAASGGAASNCDQLVPCSMRKNPKTSGATNRRRSHKALSDAGDAIFPLSPIGISIPMQFYCSPMRDHSAAGAPLACIFSGRWKIFHPCAVGRRDSHCTT